MMDLRNTLICAVCAIAAVSIVSCATNQIRSAEKYPASFETWVRDRVGPVVYPEGSSKTWDDVIAITDRLGARAVKTWVRSDTPGDALARLQTESYRALIRRSRTVLFNISPAYIVNNYRDGTIDPASLEGIRNEWRDITLMLCREWPSRDRTFLLSVGGEINVYLGTKDAYPDFPVAEYVNACHAGMAAALDATGRTQRPRVFSVAEFQGDKEYERFAAQWAPQFETDLISLSYYTFYRSLEYALALLRPHVKALGPFREHRLMLGEYGPSLESCNWNQAEHTRWHHDILKEAYRERLQFAFFYEIADHEFVIKTGSHDGLVRWTPNAEPRLAWDYYRALYREGSVRLPEGNVYEKPSDLSPTPSAPNFTVSAVTPVSDSIHAGDRVSFAVTVDNTGTQPSPDSTVNLFVDDRMVAWIWFAGIDPGSSIHIESGKQAPRFVWNARPGEHRVTAFADPLLRIQETSECDNAKTDVFNVTEQGR